MNKDIFLTNSLGNKKDKFIPINPKKIGMYVCGPTIYDNPHIGNARPLVVFDILFKVLKCKYGNNSVTYVRNITDIDDKIITSSIEKKISIGDLTKKITNILKMMDIKHLFKSELSSLTPGQLRWVDLASKIAAFPKVLFIDELELHLNMVKIKSLCKILYRKVNYDGITIIATTQNKEFFDGLSSVCININHGRITSVRSKYNKK